MRGRIACVTCFVLGLCLVFSLPAGAQLTSMEKLGKFLYFDKALSEPTGQACASCHWPGTGFADKNKGLPVSQGVIHGMFGGRNAPSSAYMAAAPKLNYVDGNWVGGAFWDGRATGYVLDHPLADQALGPFLNPVEMHNGYYEGGNWIPQSLWVVRDAINSRYACLFLDAFNDYATLNQVQYEDIGTAIGWFERSAELNRFNSRFDDFWRACKKAGIDPTAITDPRDPR